MNSFWKKSLLEELVLADNAIPAAFTASENSGKRIYTLTHLGILKVTGKDAGKLLQGQLTCNVNELGDANSSFAAMCNPKGRVIATFLVVKMGDMFLLVLPLELMETVQKKLQMYVLRSDAKIENGCDTFSLIGLCEPGRSGRRFSAAMQENAVSVNFPGSIVRKLVITDADTALRLRLEAGSEGFRQADLNEWRMLDIVSGVPWITAAASEEFIPQMLNLDKLGAISFNKGCYTGQEIVARTHYLGKAKRELFLAECRISRPPEPNAAIINRDHGKEEMTGNVLQAQQDGHFCKMLVVLQTTDININNLGFMSDDQARLTLLPLAYD